MEGPGRRPHTAPKHPPPVASARHGPYTCSSTRRVAESCGPRRGGGWGRADAAQSPRGSSKGISCGECGRGRGHCKERDTGIEWGQRGTRGTGRPTHRQIFASQQKRGTKKQSPMRRRIAAERRLPQTSEVAEAEPMGGANQSAPAGMKVPRAIWSFLSWEMGNTSVPPVMRSSCMRGREANRKPDVRLCRAAAGQPYYAPARAGRH